MRKIIFIGLLFTLQSCVLSTTINSKPATAAASNEMSDPRVMSLFARGNYLLQNGDYPGAEAAFNEALKLSPNSPTIRRKLAEIYIEQGKFDKAFEHASAVLKADPEDPTMLFLVAQIEAGRSNFEEARKHLLKLKAIQPDNDDASMLLWRVDANLGRFDEAEAILNDLIKNYPDVPELRLFIGLVYEAHGKLPEAKKELEAALAMNPHQPGITVKLGDIEKALGNKEGAKALYRKALDLNPGDVEARQKLMALEGNANPDAPLPGSPEELGLRTGVELLEQEKFKEAAIEFEKLRAARPNNSLIALYLGIAYEGGERYDDALKAYESVPMESSLYPDAALRRAIVLIEKGNTQEAYGVLHAAVGSYPSRKDLALLLAKICIDTERYQEAIDILNALRVLAPDDDGIYFLLGVAYGESGKKAEGLDIMKKILARNPESAEALNYIGYSYAEDGIRLDEAELMILKAMKLKPGSAAITDSLGWIYYQRGNYPKAVTILEMAHTLDPKESVIAEHLADAYAKAGRKDDAVKMYRKALDTNPTAARAKLIREKLGKLGVKP